MTERFNGQGINGIGYNYAEQVSRFRLMDDVFMTAYFNGNIPCTEHVLRIILNKPGLAVTSVQVQRVLKNLQGRSLILDIHSVDEDGSEYDIEIQRGDEGACPQRARYLSALLDSSVAYPIGKYCEKLRENYVIFITENDVLGYNQPIYLIERHILGPDGRPLGSFNDGAHIVFVNGARRHDQTELGRLMHDFFCTRAADMYSPLLAERMRQLKETKEGERIMTSVVDEIRDLQKYEIAMKMLDDVDEGTLPLANVARYTGLPLNVINDLAAQRAAAH